MHGVLRALVALAFALTGVVWVAQSPAMACTCGTSDPERLAKRADAVFVATVDEVTQSGDTYEYDVTATRAYQGSVESSVVVTSPRRAADCSLGELPVGASYVFYVKGDASPYTADLCGGTAPVGTKRIERIEQLLGSGTAVEPPPPPEATLTRVEESAPPGFGRMAAPGAALAIAGLLGLLVVRRLARR